jgi:hypothetical protein
LRRNMNLILTTQFPLFPVVFHSPSSCHPAVCARGLLRCIVSRTFEIGACRPPVALAPSQTFFSQLSLFGLSSQITWLCFRRIAGDIQVSSLHLFGNVAVDSTFACEARILSTHNFRQRRRMIHAAAVKCLVDKAPPLMWYVLCYGFPMVPEPHLPCNTLYTPPHGNQ